MATNLKGVISWQGTWLSDPIFTVQHGCIRVRRVSDSTHERLTLLISASGALDLRICASNYNILSSFQFIDPFLLTLSARHLLKEIVKSLEDAEKVGEKLLAKALMVTVAMKILDDINMDWDRWAADVDEANIKYHTAQ